MAGLQHPTIHLEHGNQSQKPPWRSPVPAAGGQTSGKSCWGLLVKVTELQSRLKVQARQASYAKSQSPGREETGPGSWDESAGQESLEHIDFPEPSRLGEVSFTLLVKEHSFPLPRDSTRLSKADDSRSDLPAPHCLNSKN